MTSIWLLIVATLGGALLGGAMGLLNTRMLTKSMFSRERERLILAKLEELHEALSQFALGYADLALLASSDAEAVDLLKQHWSIPEARVAMLVGFYAPALRPKLENVERLSDEFDRALGRLVGSKGGDDEERVAAMAAAEDAGRRLERACKEMQAELISLSRGYV